MTETLSKTIASSDVVGFAHDLGIFLRALFAQRFYGCNSVLCEVAFKRFSGQCNDFLPTVDSAKRPWPTSIAPRRASLGRAARGSVAPRKMACQSAAGRQVLFLVQGHRRALEGAALAAAPC
jgi:hypothetical protein